MKYKIFISKGTLDLSRNREHRRLEAQLDSQQNAGRLNPTVVYKPLKGDASSPISADTYEQETKLGNRDAKLWLDETNSSPAHTLGDASKQDNSKMTQHFLNSLYPQEPLLFCSYITDCNKACFQNTDKYNLCMIRKFKDKYKNFDYGGQLGL